MADKIIEVLRAHEDLQAGERRIVSADKAAALQRIGAVLIVGDAPPPPPPSPAKPARSAAPPPPPAPVAPPAASPTARGADV